MTAATLDLSALSHRSATAAAAESLREQELCSAGPSQFPLPPVQNVRHELGAYAIVVCLAEARCELNQESSEKTSE